MAKEISSKKAPNQSGLIKILIIGGVVTALLFAMTGSETPTAKKKLSTSFTPGSKKKKDIFEKEDYTAQFDSQGVLVKNSFKPLIIKGSAALANAKPLRSDAIPASFAGGEANWIYTGNMTVNGVPNALLENSSNSDTIVLRPGQKWKTMTLQQVQEAAIVIAGPDGIVKTVRLGEDEFEMTDNAVAANIAPLPAPDPNSIQNNPNNRRQRGRNASLDNFYNGQALSLEPLQGPIGE